MILLTISLISLGIWLYLLGFWGNFWRAKERLETQHIKLESYPSIAVIIPARNEAELLPQTLRSLLVQDYPGDYSIVLIDDGSTDGTAQIAQEFFKTNKLKIIESQVLPQGWTGKLWAIQQGISYAQQQNPTPKYFLLTDADIEHSKNNLQQLVIKAELEQKNLVSLMVLLRCQSFWEKLLIPAFVFFFQKLYPFAWVNDPRKQIAAAAGGCILINAQALNEIGGIEVIKQALIDDCSLAKVIKQSNFQNKSIWLGLTNSTHSLRPYNHLETIWSMVARTAYTQLNHSPALLIGTMIAMSLVYLIAPVSLTTGIVTANWLLTIIGLLTWLLMLIAYLPTIRLYQISLFWALSLPAIALLYTLMTIDSAIQFWQGKGGNWKGRVYKN
ncbi:hopene-associated glycosyltransferase HpnB [Stanieria cyanosphaera PCC 7437]|uniref:Hopene-associated glycosyltransferase HpnB n=1 Tax=Stanieria cyanosphaera (strain ATCC 29371 / PCC 7437) TaxID=111780 RepID=K9XTS4_STAC7|nr:hopene-associated glycosyltransferase HpnB [Stanieria cyanosphaera PCC 7437]